MIRKIVTQLADEMKEQGKKWVYPRAFCYMSHIVGMIYLHIGHAQSITEVCDALNHNKWSLNTIRNSKAPWHNTLSNANRIRSPEIVKRLYYALVEFYQKAQPDFSEEENIFCPNDKSLSLFFPVQYTYFCPIAQETFHRLRKFCFAPPLHPVQRAHY